MKMDITQKSLWGAGGFMGVTFREKKNNCLAENQISFLCGNYT